MKTRREFLAANALLTASLMIRPVTLKAQDASLSTLIRTYTGGSVIRESRVKLDIAMLVDNGNSVPVDVTVDSPMTEANHVVSIAIFNEKNPQHDVAEFTLGPRNAQARVSTRIRLAMTQKIVAIAKMNDGSYWSHAVEVVVTLAACIEE